MLSWGVTAIPKYGTFNALIKHFIPHSIYCYRHTMILNIIHKYISYIGQCFHLTSDTLRICLSLKGALKETGKMEGEGRWILWQFCVGICKTSPISSNIWRKPFDANVIMKHLSSMIFPPHSLPFFKGLYLSHG